MNSSDSIANSIQTLAELNKMLKLRHEAAYDRDERLNEFVILKGKFYLDSCGNSSRVVRIDGEVGKLKDVMTVQEFNDALGPEAGFTSALVYPPSEQAKCRVCDKGWTISNCEDFERLQDGHYLHRNCAYIETAARTGEQIQNVFKIAGFDHVIFNAIPNSYYREKSYYASPWYKVETPFGNITIGWRKRVLEISWKESGRNLADFFTDDVTKGPDYIHAWGYSKAVEYLTKLRELLYISDEYLEKQRGYLKNKN